MDSDSDLNPDSRFLWLLSHLYYFSFYYHVMYGTMHLVKKKIIQTCLADWWGLLWPGGFEFEAVGFGFGFEFEKKGLDSDSAGFVFEVPGFGSGFAHH